MVTVAIIGVLAGISVNVYKAQQIRSKRTEAMVGLATLWEAQMAYFVETQRFSPTFDRIDFGIEGGRRLSVGSYQGARYVYQLSQPWGSNSFYCMATANLDDDAWPDVLEIAEKGR